MNNKLVFKSLLVVIVTVLFASCDKDYNDIGTDVIGDNHFDFDRDISSTVVAFNQATGFVQSNNPTVTATSNLTVNPIGVYDNAVFGKTKANFVTQVQLGNTTTVFGDNLVIDSVYLSIPYFSKKKSTTDGKGIYELQSVYAGPDAKINLSVFESGYFINDLDPDTNSQEQMKYFNNDQSFGNNKIGAQEDGTSSPHGPRLNNAADPAQNTAFVFSKEEIVLKTEDEDGDVSLTRTAPAMRLKLNSNFFKKKIIEAPANILNNNSNFKNYFRGLYFQVEEVSGNSLAMMNFTQGTITIYYKEDKVTTPATGPSVTTRVSKKFEISLTGNRVSLLEETPNGTNANYLAAIASGTPNPVSGDTRLYLKGGQGSMTIIDLFGNTDVKKVITVNTNGVEVPKGTPGGTLVLADGANGTSDEIDAIKAKGWLINEANLTFHIDRDVMQNQNIQEPERIYLYDLTNKRPLYDYSTDGSTFTDTKRNKAVFGGIIDTLDDGTGIKYKIRITNHIRNIIRLDSTNVRLGLVVTESINDVRNAKLKTPVATSSVTLDRIPVASVLNPFGTVLWGNTPEVPEDKKLKLEIYYTKPN